VLQIRDLGWGKIRIRDGEKSGSRIISRIPNTALICVKIGGKRSGDLRNSEKT